MKFNFRRPNFLSTVSFLLEIGLLISLLFEPLGAVQAAPPRVPEPAPDAGRSFITVPAEVNKTFTPIAITTGGTSRLKVTVFNLNANELTDATWTDDFTFNTPNGIKIADPPNISTQNCGAGATVTDKDGNALQAGDTSLKLTGGTVPPQAQSGAPGECIVEVDVTSTTIGNLINTIPEGNADPNQAHPYSLVSYTIDPQAPGGPAVRIFNTTPASATLNVVGVESPSLNKAFAPNTVWAGESSTLTITIHNNDDDYPLNEVTMYDELPTDVKVANPTNASLSGCGEGSGALLTDESGNPLAADDTTIKMVGGTIAPDSDCVISVDVHSLVMAAYTNEIPAGPAGPGSIETREGVTNESPADDSLNVQAFSIDKDFSETTIAAGQTTQVEIAIQNHATIEFTGALLDDVLPAGLEFVAGSTSVDCVPASSTADFAIVTGANPNDTLRMTNGVLPAETTCTISATVEASMSATVGAHTNDIPIGALTTAEGATNHTSTSDSVNVQSLGIDKDFTETQIAIGATTPLTLTLTNPSPKEFTNASLVDVLPEGLVFVNDGSASTTCPSGNIAIGGTNNDTLTLSGATLPSGSLASPGSCTITATVKSDASKPPGEKTNTIPVNSITTAEGGTNYAEASDSITVTGLVVSKGFDPPRFVAGQTTQLIISISNPASISFTDASISDTLPNTPNDELYFTGTPTTTCTDGSAQVAYYPNLSGKMDTVSLTGGTIPPNDLCYIFATVTTSPDAGCVPDPDDDTNTVYENIIPAFALHTAEGASNDKGYLAEVRVENLRIEKTFYAELNDPDNPPAQNANDLPVKIAYPKTAALLITITNPEGGDALTAMSFTDTLPEGLVVADPPNTDTSCDASTSPVVTAAAGQRDIFLSDGSIAAATTEDKTCWVRVDVTATQDTSAKVYSNEIPKEEINTAEGKTNCIAADDNLQVLALEVEKEFQYSSFQAGDTIELTITLKNYSGEAYTNVSLEDILPDSPDDQLYFTGTPTTTCNNVGGGEDVSYVGGSPPTTPHRSVELTNATIPAAATPIDLDNPGECTITAYVTTNASASDASYTNTIPKNEVTTDEGPTNTSAAEDDVSVYTFSEGLTADKRFSPSIIDIFETSVLRLQFTAPADTDLTNFAFTDILPDSADGSVTLADPANISMSGCGEGSGAELTDESGNPGSLGPGDTTVRLIGGTIAKGETCTVQVTVTSDDGTTAGTDYTNTITPAQITNDEDRNPSGDVTATLTLKTPSTLIVRKDFDPEIVGPDGRSRLTITLENEGDWNLVDIDLDDFLPGDTSNGIVIAPIPNVTTTCDGGVITADPGTQTIHMEDGSIPKQVGGVNGLCTINVNIQGKTTDGSTPAAHTNTIPVSNVVATVENTPSTMNPQGPASDDLTVKDLDIEIVKGFDPVLVYGGADSVMSIILRNPNPSAELIDITFTDNMWLTDPDTADYPGYPDAVTRPDYPILAYPKGEMILIDPPQFDASDCGPDAELTRIDESTFLFSGGYLAPGDECTLTLRTTMTVNGNRTNTIPVEAVTTFNGATNKTATSATLTNLAGASVSKSFAPNPVAAGLGSYSLLTIEIRSTASVVLYSLGLVDELPPGLEVADWQSGLAAAPTNDCGGDLTDENDNLLDGGDTIIKLSGGTLGKGFSNCFLKIPVSGAEPGDHKNEIPQGTLTNTDNITNIRSTEDTLTLTPYSLGNRVWYDTDNDGVMDSGEVGVENVRVELYRDRGTLGVFDAGDVFIKFDTTDADGYYRFDDLGGDDYVVVIPEENFDAGAALAGYLSSGTSMDAGGTVSDSIGPDPDDDADNEDNGVTTFSGNTVDYVSAAAITLGPDDSEPEDDNDPTTNPETGEAANDQSNRTVDFGFYRLQLGNLVFHDVVTADGAYSSGTDGLVEDATVQIFSSDGSGGQNAEINVGPDGIWGTDDDTTGGVQTGSNGEYRFSGLPAGSYIVKVTADGYRSTIDTANQPDTDDPDVNADNNDNGVGIGEGTIVSNEITLTPGSDGAASNNVITNNTGTTYDPTVDFGFIPIVSIGSIVWEDTDRDGSQDDGEPGIENAVVTLLDGSGNPVSGVPAQTTGTDGLYYFGSLPEGDYKVQVEMPAKYYPTINQTTSDNDDSENDSNIATTNGNVYTSGTFTLTGDGEPDGVDSNIADSDAADDGLTDNGDDDNGNMTVDFGFVRNMSIGNRVFKDDGGPTGAGTLDNGIMDGDEEPFANVRVELYQDTDGTPGLQAASDTLVNFDTTDANGYYLFDKLAPDNYYVHIPKVNFEAGGALEGWHNSTPTGSENSGVAGNSYTPNTDRDDNGVNNANPQANGISSGLLELVYGSEPTAEGELSGEADPGSPANEGFDPTGWDGPNSRGRFNESDANSNLTVDFGFIPPLSLGNRVWIDDGSIAASPGVNLLQMDDGLMNGTEAGVENVELNLYFDADDDGAYTSTDVDGIDETIPYRTTTTDAAGFYLFDSLPEGRFYVQVDSDNFSSGNALYRYHSSTDNGFGNQTVDINDNGTDDASYLTNGIRSIDFVLDYNGEPTAEADLPANTAANRTAYGDDLRGRFGEEDDDSNLTLDFGFVQPHSIGNRVWRDSDNSGTINGVDDANPGIANVTVNLYAGIDAGGDGIPDDLTVLATTTTDSDGYYLFGSLPAGDYIVGIPASNFDDGTDALYGLRSSSAKTTSPARDYTNPEDSYGDQEDHGIDTAEAPPTPSSAVYSPIILLGNDEVTGESDLSSDTGTYGTNLRGVSGERDENSDLTVDFGFFGGIDVPFSIGNHLWYDSGAGGGSINNGVREVTETPVEGARVELYRDGNGNGTLESYELFRFDVTDSDGFYLFDNLDPGEYYVHVAAGNFQDTFDPDGSGTDYSSAPGVLRGWYSSQPTGEVETDTDDSDDNGIDVNFPETSGVTSSVVILERGVNEPSGESHLSSDTGTNLGFNPTEDDGPASRGRFDESDATSNLTVDFGFIPPLSVGNRVWIDDGAGEATFGAGYNNGEMDGTEKGVAGVKVNLYLGTTLLATDTTDSDGYYLFDRLQPGTSYTIVIAADNFDSGGPLEHYKSSTGNDAAIDDDDILDDGVDDVNYLTNGISSTTFTMSHSTEPTDESDLPVPGDREHEDNVGRYGQTDSDSNLSLDFGFYRPRSIGNRLWFDTDNDRLMDGAELPVPDGVRVSLYLDETDGSGGGPDGVPDGPALRFDETDDGYYLFDYLPPRNYLVGVDASNFQTGGKLVGYYSSTGNRSDTSNSNDSRDNGIDQTSPQSSTYGILSPTIDLTGDSPTGETDLSSDTGTGLANNPTEDDGPDARGRYGETDASSNLTIDFGFYKVEIGHLVYRDVNANGTFDDGIDVKLDDVTVQLFKSDGSGNITGEIITGADGILNTDDDGWGPDGVNGTGDDGDGGIKTGGTFGAGQYLFAGLPAGHYIVRVTTPDAHVSTIDHYNQSDNDDPDDGVDANDNGVGVGEATKDQVDSEELTINGGEQIAPAVSYNHTTGTTTDTSVDFGFTYAYTLGNRVWYDTNNSSAIDNGEGDDGGTPVGVDGVRVELYADNDLTTVLATTTTANGGYYLFDYLTADDYIVVIPEDNFRNLGGGDTVPGDPLEGYWSSATAMGADGSLTEGAAPLTPAPDPDNPGADTVSGTADDDIDSDDNGTRQTSGVFNGAVISQAVTLGTTIDSEPTGETDLQGGSTIGDQPDNRSNMKLDFGFYKTEIGDLVFGDLSKNGNYESGESLLENMTVQLFNSDGTVKINVGPDGILGTNDDNTGDVSTDSNGNYSFSGLPEGNYVVKASGLTDYTSSKDSFDSTDNANPNTNTDDNDNGIGVGEGLVASGQLTMDAGYAGAKTENTVDNNLGFTSDPTVDFGFINAYSLGNRVWFDTDNDAVIDDDGAGGNPDEVGIEGVVVELYNTVGMIKIDTGPDGIPGNADDGTGEVTTDADGYYLFDYLNAGEYVVVIPESQFSAGGKLEGYHSSQTSMDGTGSISENPAPDPEADEDDSDDNGTLNGDAVNFPGAVVSAPVTLGTGSSEPTGESDLAGGSDGDQPDGKANMTVDFGLYKADIGDLVFRDDNANGSFDDGSDPRLEDVVVKLFAADDTTEILVGPDGKLGTADDAAGGVLTDGSGNYHFSGLPDGEYVIKVTTPAGLVSTNDNADSSDTADPDDATNNNDNGIGISASTQVSVSSGELSLRGGEGDEAGTPGAVVTFDNSTGTTYDSTIDFGFTYAYSLGNRVWYDTDNSSAMDNGEGDDSGTPIGVDGVRVELYASSDLTTPLATTTTTNGGYYLFDYLSAGDYMVVIPEDNFRDLGGGDTIPGDPLEGYWSSGTSMAAGGTLSETPAPDPDTDEDDLDDNGTLQTSGDFNRAVISAAVTLGPTGDSEPTDDDDLQSGVEHGSQPDGRSNLSVDFGFYRTEIGNLVFGDNDENGNYDGSDTPYSGITVQLFSSSGAEINVGPDGELGTTDDASGGVQTNNSGIYLFTGLPAGDYIVRAAAPNGTVSTIDSYNQTDTTNPFTNADNNDNGVGENNGVASANALTMLPGRVETNIAIDHSSGTTTDLTVDFGFTTVFALGNRVWFDTNNDSQLNNSEVGVNGVIVELYDADGSGNPTGAALDSDTTANGGYYLFDYLEDGNYVVVIPASNFSGGVLEGYWSSATTRSDDGSISETSAADPDNDADSDDNGTRQTGGAFADAVISAAVTLGPLEPTAEADEETGVGQGDQPDENANLTVDFGFYTMTLGDLVWIDSDNSGQVNGAEAGRDDVTVQLWSADGSTQLDSVTTSGGGSYSFRGLAQGNYFVRIPAAEFEGTEELVDYVTSTGALVTAPTTYEYEPAPDADINTTNSDDNGSQKGGITGNGGYVQSEIVTLTPITEASYDNNSGTTSEPRLDFGFTPQNRAYTIAKTVTDVGGDGDTGSVDEAGDVISYQIEVTNTGNQILTGITLSDSLVPNVGSATESSIADGYLEIGETWTWTYTYTVTQADLDDNGGGDGDIDNTATVSSTELADESDSRDVPVDQVPAITLTKSGSFDDNDGNGEADPGETISYTFTVKNTGNLTLTNITISDPDLTVNGGPIASLAPGETDSITFTGTYAITQAEIDAGQKINTATVTGKDPDDNDVSDDDTHTTSLVQIPSLAIVKEVSNDDITWDDDSVIVEEGAPVYFRIRVENTGNITLTNLTIEDGMVACTLARATDITGNDDDVFEVGEEWAYTCTVTALVGINSNTATADTDETDPPVEDVAEYRSLPDISLLKSVNDASPKVNDIVTFTIKVSNKGNANAANVVVGDKVPNGFIYIPGSMSGGDVQDESSPAGSGLSWTINNLDRNVTVMLTFQARVEGSGIYKNVAQVTACDQPDSDSTPDNDDGDQSEDDEDSATADPDIDSADLELSKTVSDASPSVGDIITFSIIVTNEGPDTATNVMLEDIVPDGFTYRAGTISGGDSQNDTDPSGTGLTWSIASLNSGANTELKFEAVVNASGTFKNVAQVTASDQSDRDSTPDNDKGDQIEDDEDSAIASPNSNSADVRLAKVVDNASPGVGDIVTFTITVTNEGLDTVTNLVVRDVVPDGFTYVASSITGGGSADDTNPATSGLTWDIYSLPNGDSVDLTFQVEVNASGNYKNAAQVVEADQDDPDSTPDNDDGDQSEDDEDSAKASPATGDADLSLTKDVDNPFPNLGETVTFTITVSNAGPDAATNVTITDIVPGGFNYVGGSIAGGNNRNESDPSGAGLSWIILSLNSGDSVQLTFQATVKDTGSYINLAQVTASDQDDPDSTPNNDDGDHSEDDEDVATASPPADLFLSKTVDNNDALVGETVKFTITVRNEGPHNATGVKVGDELPTGYTIVSATTSQGSYDDVSGLWEVGEIEAYELATLEITATVNVAGSHTNVAQVTASDQGDPDSTPNNDDGDQSEDDEASATIGSTHVFDPPAGWKTVTPDGWPALVWQMVWINNGNLVANPVRIVDPIPHGTTYIAGSLVCEERGASTRTTCEYDPVNNQIVWEGSIAADFGALTEDEADNEVVITFSTTVGSEQDSARNQALAHWDENNDGVIDRNDANVANNAPIRTDDPATLSPADYTIARPPSPGETGAGEGAGDDALEDVFALPTTGFAPGRETAISPPPNLHYYQEYTVEMMLEIPKLNVISPIVGIPLDAGNWDAAWLLNEIGYLGGTAYPTTAGNTALSAHAYLSNGNPGPFSDLDQLAWGDHIRINMLDAVYVYEVQEQYFVSPDDLSPLHSENQDWITLITCYQYDEHSQGYLWRSVVRAVLVEKIDK